MPKYEKISLEYCPVFWVVVLVSGTFSGTFRGTFSGKKWLIKSGISPN